MSFILRSVRILVLGGDGYLGWPTAMNLSAAGHDVAVVDNFMRRLMSIEMGAGSLTPIRSLQERTQAWKEVAGKDITVFVGDLTDAQFVDDTFTAHRETMAAIIRKAKERAGIA